MPKYSVRKPMTVLVAVILIIVLGIVSFTRMTPDLLPNLDFPYVVVITAYPGASPEKVESTLTKPIEQAAATLDDIEKITSTSNANYSLVMLQFSDSANMDACTMNLREKLDTLSGSWPELVTTSTILKINPNMLPVSVAAVSRDGYDTVALSSFVQDTLAPRLEGIEGVASLSYSGIVTESVNVIIRQDKIDLLNERIRSSVDQQFVEAEDEISDNESELDEAGKAIGGARSKLRKAETAANEQFATAQSGIDQGRAGLESALSQVETAISAASAFNQTQYDEAVSQLSALEAQLASLEASENPDAQQLSALRAAVQQAQSAVAGLEVVKQAHDNLPALYEQKDALKTQLAGLDDSQRQLDAGKEETGRQFSSAKGKLSSAEKQIEEGKEKLADARQQLSDAKLDAYDASDASSFITMDMVSSILSAQDFSMPAGYVTEDNVQWLVYVGNRLSSFEELSGLMLMDLGMDDLGPVYLSDVADIILKDDAESVYAKINGSDGVLITFSKQSNYATATASDNIRAELKALCEEYDGLSFTTLMDQGDYIHLIVNSVLMNLAQGAVLAILILLLFLWDIRPTFIVACSIPISVTFAIVLMYFSGVTLNIISMSGLAVGVGMLVDNSIVVIENIYRLRRNGVSTYKAAVSGAVQVAGAITASTLTTVCVFTPIVFIQGLTRQLFQDMALTIGYSLLASLIVALTLIPAMSGGLLKKDVASRKRGLLVKLADGYAKVLPFFLRHKAPVILLSIILLGVSGYLTLSRGFSYMPTMDTTQVSVSLSMQDENAQLSDTEAVAETLYERIKDIDGVETVGIMQSSGMASMIGLSIGNASTSKLTLYVVLNEDKSLTASEICDRIEEAGADLPAEISATASGMDISALTSSGITIQVFGDNLEMLQKTAGEIAQILENVEGTCDVSDGMEKTTPVLQITVDKEKAMAEGLTTAQVYMEVADAITVSKTAATVEDTQSEVVVYATDEETSLADIKNLTITVTDREGEERDVLLSDIATFENTQTLQAITRDGQRRYIAVTAGISDGHNVTLVTQAAKDALSGYQLQEGITLRFSGENETIMDSMQDLLLMLLLGVIIVYLIMVAQFQSLLSPFIVMLTIPLAFTGGLLALYVSGSEVSIVAMIGFVMLVGIIVNNGIVLIDCMNRLRIAGLSRQEAVIEACRIRMRPVLMTALTTILGLIPLAIGVGMGSDLIQPVAVVAIGGLIYATLMTLFVVPVVYDAWCKKEPRAVSEAEMELISEDEVSELD